MYILANLHWFILLLGALVFFHELGHFLVAKACGVRVLRFSLGFGPRLFGFTRGETEYLISALPLGGYVKMLGETPGVEVPPEDAGRSFAHKSVWQRSAIVVAGPVFNLILALTVYFGMFTGTQTFGDTRLGIVSVGEPAWNAGLRPGDKIVAVDGEPVGDWDALREHIGTRPGEALRMTYERDGSEHVVTLHPEAKDEANVFQEAEKRGRIGVSARYIKAIVGVVDSESPAALAGVHTGDRVLRVNGQPVAAWHELRAKVRSTASGAPVRLVIARDGGEREVTVQPNTARPQGLDADLFSSADTTDGYTGLVSAESLVAKVEADTPAAELGLVQGDRPVALKMIRSDGSSVERPIGSYFIDLAAFSGLDARNRFVLTWQHGREILQKPLELEAREQKDEFKNTRTEYVFGAQNDDATLDTYTYDRDVGPVEALREAAKQVGADMGLIATGLSKLVSGKLSFDNMGGPIMLFVIAEKTAKRGPATYLRAMAMISVNLGMLNLLPIPVLDGGHLMFCLVEAVRRRPPSLRFRELANMVGLALLLLLMVLVLKNDILRYVLG
jgi:regulator of sigma E protease